MIESLSNQNLTIAGWPENGRSRFVEFELTIGKTDDKSSEQMSWYSNGFLGLFEHKHGSDWLTVPIWPYNKMI